MTVSATVSPLGPLPWHVEVSATATGMREPAAGEDVLAPLRRVGSPIVDHVGPMPYVQWQHLQDVGAPSGRHHYWKTASYRSLPDSAIETLASAAL